VTSSLTRWFGNLSLARKLTGIGVVATTVSIVFAFAVRARQKVMTTLRQLDTNKPAEGPICAL